MSETLPESGTPSDAQDFGPVAEKIVELCTDMASDDITSALLAIDVRKLIEKAVSEARSATGRSE